MILEWLVLGSMLTAFWWGTYIVYGKRGVKWLKENDEFSPVCCIIGFLVDFWIVGVIFFSLTQYGYSWIILIGIPAILLLWRRHNKKRIFI